MTSNNGDTLFSSHLNFIRVKVQVDPRLPLVQNIRIRLDNGVNRTVECKYKRVFHSCASCNKIGHLVQACPSIVAQLADDCDQIAARTFSRFGTRFICNFSARTAELTWQEWIHDHRSRGFTRIRFNRALSRYYVFETLPQDILLNTNRFEGIIHLSDDDEPSDDEPPIAPEQQTPLPEQAPADDVMPDAVSLDNIAPTVPPNDQEDPDYMAFVQTLTEEELPRDPPCTDITFLSSAETLAPNLDTDQLLSVDRNSPPSLDINLSANPDSPFPEPAVGHDPQLYLSYLLFRLPQSMLQPH